MILLPWLFRRLSAYRRTNHASLHPAPRPSHSGGRGTVGLVLHQARFELLGFLRNQQARFFTLLLPLLFLVIFVTVFGNESVGATGVRAATYFVPGIAAMGVISASFVNLVMSIVAERESGALKRRRATPVPAWVLIAGRTITAMAVSIAVMSALLLVGKLAYDVDVPATALPAVLTVGLAGAGSFAILGFAVAGLIGSADAAQPMVQAVTLPLYFISGVFIPNLSLPDWLRTIGQVFPVEHLAAALHTALDPSAAGISVAWSDLLVLVIWALVGVAVALRRFSWVPTAATA